MRLKTTEELKRVPAEMYVRTLYRTERAEKLVRDLKVCFVFLLGVALMLALIALVHLG